MICLCISQNLQIADDAKLNIYVSDQEDGTDLQKSFCALKEWSDYWLLKVKYKDISQGSVATRMRCGGIFNHFCARTLLLSFPVKGF